MVDSLLARLAEIAETEFADVVITSEINMGKLIFKESNIMQGKGE